MSWYDRFLRWRARRRHINHLKRLRKMRVVLDRAAQVPDRFPSWKPFQ